MLRYQLFSIEPKDKIAASELSPDHFQMPFVLVY
jgi:hypothetical protein